MHDVFTTRYTLDKVISVGWQQYAKNFTNILVIVFLIYFPINLIVSLLPVADAVILQDFDQFVTYMRVVQFLEVFVAVVATISVTKLVEASLQGQAITWQQSLKHAFSRWFVVVLTSLIGGVILIWWTLLLIIPGIIWMVYYSFAIYVVTLRGISGNAALKYSKSIVKGQWWRVFGYHFVLLLMVVVIGGVYGLFLSLLPDNSLVEVVAVTVADLLDMLFITMCVVFFLNNDRRGVDSQQVEPTSEQPVLVPPQEA
jgi:hypothetical protein